MTEKDPKKIKRYFILGFDLQQPSLNQHIGMCIFGHEEDSIRQSIRGDFVETIRIEEFEKLKEQNRIMREALEFYAGFEQNKEDYKSKWWEHVCDSYSGEEWAFDWEGHLQDEPWGVARKALKQIEEDE